MAVGGRRPWYQTALPDTLPLLSLAPPHLLRLLRGDANWLVSIPRAVVVPGLGVYVD